jgi:hypothetical protein
MSSALHFQGFGKVDHSTPVSLFKGVLHLGLQLTVEIFLCLIEIDGRTGTIKSTAQKGCIYFLL